MKSFGRLAFCIFLISISMATAAGDLVTLAQPAAGFEETLGGRTKVSGRVLVGLRIGSSPARFKADHVRVTLPSVDEVKSLCVRMTSGDGRYWALNPYTAQPPLPPMPRLDIRSRYRDELGGYDGEDIIIRVVDTEECHEDAVGLIHPVAYIAADELTSGGRQLHAYVNTGSARAALELFDESGESVSSTKCEKPKSRAAVSYTRFCTLELPFPIARGEYQLVITARALTGASTKHRFAIWWPG